MNTTIITVGGVSYEGVVAFCDGWWMAFRSDDPLRVLCYVQEDVQ